MIEAAQYNDWFYGTPHSALVPDAINLGIFGKKSLSCLIDEQDNYNIYFLEIVTSDKERLQRSLKREREPNCHEICRRFLADEKDWQEIDGIIRPEMEIVKQISGEDLSYPEQVAGVIESIKNIWYF